MTSQDIRMEGQAGRLGAVMTAVVIEGRQGKEYRVPAQTELQAAEVSQQQIDRLFAELPLGVPDEPVPQGASREGGGSPFTVHLYGINHWSKLFRRRQLLVLGTLVRIAGMLPTELRKYGYEATWIEAITAYVAILIDKTADRNSQQCIWISTNAEKAAGTFGRFALPITWDYVEVMPWSESAGGSSGNLSRIVDFISHALKVANNTEPRVVQKSAIQVASESQYDVVLTDPPYYDAIPYSDLMDFFYVWLRRSLTGMRHETHPNFGAELSPKWSHDLNDGELIDDASRFNGDKDESKSNYEDGMFRSFQACYKALLPEGRLVVVFAHKHPNAWGTLVSAIIRAGFVVDGSWPIQTERSGRLRSQTSAALSSSVWLVCRKRLPTVRPGWDNIVLTDMRERIRQRLRDFWDAGIRGPDFVWAATGPALEAYSIYPVVKKANQPGAVLAVGEFLDQVRHLVVEFVVGRVLGGGEAGDTEAAGLDPVTTYYLLHRHDFGLEPAPAGACILYAISCGLSDHALTDQYDLVAASSSGTAGEVEDEAEAEADAETEDGETGGETGSSSSTMRLKRWQARRRRTLGETSPGGQPAPLIDQIHRLLFLWRAGDVTEVNEYINGQNLRQNTVVPHVLQSLIELSKEEERSLLESISKHLHGLGIGSHYTPLVNPENTR